MALLILLGVIIVLVVVFFGISITLKEDNSYSSKIPIIEDVTDAGEKPDKEGEESDEFEFG